MNIPEGLLYTSDHEWLKLLDNGEALIGITDYAQNSLGDITFVELPEAKESFDAEAAFGVAESVKAASDLLMPIDAEIVEANAELEDAPEKVNQSPYDEGWIIRVRVQDASQIDGLLDASAYKALITEEA